LNGTDLFNFIFMNKFIFNLSITNLFFKVNFFENQLELVKVVKKVIQNLFVYL
jgi:hypothetical protein